MSYERERFVIHSPFFPALFVPLFLSLCNFCGSFFSCFCLPFIPNVISRARPLLSLVSLHHPSLSPLWGDDPALALQMFVSASQKKKFLYVTFQHMRMKSKCYRFINEMAKFFHLKIGCGGSVNRSRDQQESSSSAAASPALRRTSTSAKPFHPFGSFASRFSFRCKRSTCF